MLRRIALRFWWCCWGLPVGASLSAQEVPPCSRVERMVVKGTSMEPLIRNGSRVYLHHDYYACGNAIRRGDIVAFRNGAEKIPLIKRVCALPEDSVALSGGYLLVNGDTLRNSAGDFYHFTPAQCRMIGMYTATGHIPNGSLLVFGDNVRVSTDSRAFGVCGQKELMGKFSLEPPPGFVQP